MHNDYLLELRLLIILNLFVKSHNNMCCTERAYILFDVKSSSLIFSFHNSSNSKSYDCQKIKNTLPFSVVFSSKLSILYNDQLEQEILYQRCNLESSIYSKPKLHLSCFERNNFLSMVILLLCSTIILNLV